MGKLYLDTPLHMAPSLSPPRFSSFCVFLIQSAKRHVCSSAQRYGVLVLERPPPISTKAGKEHIRDYSYNVQNTKQSTSRPKIFQQNRTEQNKTEHNSVVQFRAEQSMVEQIATEQLSFEQKQNPQKALEQTSRSRGTIHDSSPPFRPRDPPPYPQRSTVNSIMRGVSRRKVKGDPPCVEQDQNTCIQQFEHAARRRKCGGGRLTGLFTQPSISTGAGSKQSEPIDPFLR